MEDVGSIPATGIMAVAVNTDKLRERFWQKVDKGEPGECWPWTASTYPSGYGAAWAGRDRKVIGAHRFAYEVSVGEIPEGMQIHHICRNRLCCNPAHLQVVTPNENRALVPERTHCPQGHEYSEDNTYVNRKGRKVCRKCQLAAQRRWYRRQYGDS